jgi:hypothetical protein
MPGMPLAVFGHGSFLTLIFESILEVVHMGGGATVVVISGDGVQIHVGGVQMIHVCDVLMNYVDGVRMIRVGDSLMILVAVVQMILVFDAQILDVDSPI